MCPSHAQAPSKIRITAEYTAAGARSPLRTPQPKGNIGPLHRPTCLPLILRRFAGGEEPMRRLLLSLAVVCLASLVLPSDVHAQAAIAGVVKDSTGAAL